MIIATVIILVFLGGGLSLDLSDPQVLEEFSANVGNVVQDPVRARVIVDAAVEMSAEGRQMRSVVHGRVAEARQLATSYGTTRQELTAAFDSIEKEMLQANQRILVGRERVRKNVDKKEWKKLLKVTD